MKNCHVLGREKAHKDLSNIGEPIAKTMWPTNLQIEGDHCKREWERVCVRKGGGRVRDKFSPITHATTGGSDVLCTVCRLWYHLGVDPLYFLTSFH